jgi:type IV pilus assembly protein PilX
MIACNSTGRSPQRGMVLITALLLLIVVTILAVGLFRSFGLDEKIAGNVREKHRAVNAAETAEEYAEWWLANGNGGNGTGITCAPPLVAVAAAQVCSSAMATVNAASLPTPWQIGVTYAAPASMAITPTQGLSSGQNSYYYAPTFYISYLGPSPNGLGTVYQIDAAGYAGSPDTAAVIESTYLVQQSSKDLGGL